MEGTNYYEDTFNGVSFTRVGDSNKPQNEKIMDASMDLILRLPSNSVPKNLSAITGLIQDEDLVADVELKTDQPLGKCERIE